MPVSLIRPPIMFLQELGKTSSFTKCSRALCKKSSRTCTIKCPQSFTSYSQLPSLVFSLVAALWQGQIFAPIKDFLSLMGQHLLWCHEVSPSDLLPLTCYARYSQRYRIRKGQAIHGEEGWGSCPGSSRWSRKCHQYSKASLVSAHRNRGNVAHVQRYGFSPLEEPAWWDMDGTHHCFS